MPVQSAGSASGEEVREKSANQNTSSLMSHCVLWPFFPYLTFFHSSVVLMQTGGNIDRDKLRSLRKE